MIEVETLFRDYLVLAYIRRLRHCLLSLPLGGVDRDFPFTEDETQKHFSYLSGISTELSFIFLSNSVVNYIKLDINHNCNIFVFIVSDLKFSTLVTVWGVERSLSR